MDVTRRRTMSAKDLKALTVEGFERMFNEGDLSYADTTIDPGGTDHQEALGTEFIPHLKDVVTKLRAAFPDLHFEVHEAIGEGDLVATRSTMTGTHLGRLALGPLAALPPTGKKIAVPHMHFFRYRNERLIDMWHVWDVPALMRQLGVPAPEVKAERVA
jgi:predicted ester cyclase